MLGTKGFRANYLYSRALYKLIIHRQPSRTPRRNIGLCLPVPAPKVNPSPIPNSHYTTTTLYLSPISI